MDSPPQLFGRTDESEILGQLLADSRNGHSAVLVLRGEPGIGQTALPRYLTGAITRPPAATIKSRTVP